MKNQKKVDVQERAMKKIICVFQSNDLIIIIRLNTYYVFI